MLSPLYIAIFVTVVKFIWCFHSEYRGEDQTVVNFVVALGVVRVLLELIAQRHWS